MTTTATQRLDAGAVFAVRADAVRLPPGPGGFPLVMAYTPEVRQAALRAVRSKYVPPLLLRRTSQGVLILLSAPAALMVVRSLGLTYAPAVIINDFAPHLRTRLPVVGHTTTMTLADDDETRMVATLLGMGCTAERIAAEFGRDLSWVDQKIAATRDAAPSRNRRRKAA